MSYREEDLKPAQRDSSGYFLFPEHWNFQQTTLGKFLKYRWTNSPPGPQVPTDKAELDATLPVLKPSFEEKIPQDHARVTWLGHASVLLEIPIDDHGQRVTLLTDPVYSERCSPYQWIGPKRYRPPPLQVHELPEIDVVLLSHNHYDHLDDTTITKLNQRFPKLKWYVPLENSMYLTPLGVPKENIIEQNWWDSTKATFHGSGELHFSLVPVQHYSRRGIMDQNRALWGGWVVQGLGGSFFFSGDTAYCSTFKAIHHRFGKHSFSAIPIGAYEPRELFGVQHCDPAEAVQIHKEVESLSSLGIHWGTWTLTFEHYLEPKEKLSEIMAKETECPRDSFYTLNHGASKFVKWVLD
ncbi:N-acyl-phosphatidylethanolamine-hydrolyzing phospholipase D isoform X1 [Thraustotheca clavata]|uniref:N-acyl-phosphatidylethanolamine-hydrolyzing phospholipase D isoform X1 n=1 Tax=Thraustotheca clavata TaxID=74557 RepID=A0A1V9Z796_9STRA|nr:N-acyl-phosphatidylethanolamine-hydrolyzing phospholipase D isoform X1 [Thraustotheca clavata]